MKASKMINKKRMLLNGMILLICLILLGVPAMASESVTTINGTIPPTPTVTGISPFSGPTGGGTYVTITGTNFINGATVTIGGNAATGITFGSTTSITATTPVGTAGPAVDVVVINPDGWSGTLSGGFTYYVPGSGGSGSAQPSVPAPTPTSAVPNGAPINLKVDMMGDITQGNVDLDSLFLENEMSSTSKRGDISLDVYPDTLALNADQTRIKVITIRIISEPSKPPEGYVTVGRVFDLGPNGATFSVPIKLTITYDPKELPKGAVETELYIAHNTASGSEKDWVLDPSVVDTQAKTVTTDIWHFSIYAVMAKSQEEQQIAILTPTPTPMPSPATTITPLPTATPIPLPEPAPPASSPFSISIYWWFLLFASVVIGLLIFFLKKAAKPLHILVVVDDPAIRRLFTKSLEGLGYKLTTAANGVEALKFVTRKRFDLIFLDILMPDIDGSELFVRVREIDKYVTMTVITNEIDTSRLKSAMKQVPVLLMRKPLNKDDVLEAISNFTRSMEAKT